MSRTCCVWCPDWPVVAARRRRNPPPPDAPVLVLERVGAREQVRAASAQARADGVTVGMRRREAEARCPEGVCVPADEALEARTFEVVARAVETVAPRVVLERPGLCAFPTRGPSRYFGGDAALAAHVREVVAAALGDGPADVRVGVADGSFAARLAARHASADAPFVVEPGGSAAFCAPRPVSVLGDDGLASLLVRLGLHTLGDVAALPPEAVLARFGAEGRRFHDLARGIDAAPPALVTPPPDLVEQAELDPPVERVDAAAFAAKGLAGRLLFRLAERGLACTRVVIEAETEHGERLVRCWRHDRPLTPAALAERVRWQLDGWLIGAASVREAGIPPRSERDHEHASHAAVSGAERSELAGAASVRGSGIPSRSERDQGLGALTRLRLVPDEVVPADGRQLGFWGGDQAAYDRADRALARVQGLLGHDTVVTAVVQGGRTPAEQVRWVPWGEPREPDRPLVVDGAAVAWPGALPPPFPARVFDPPVAARLRDAHGHEVAVTGRGEQSAAPARLECAHLPGGGGPVRGWAGPWASDVRWWDERARRRCARWQVVVDCGTGGDVACVVVVAAGRAGVEALYD